MFKLINVLLILSMTVTMSLSARILGVFPTPSISHQVVFQKLTSELARRGHELVVLTPDPLPKNKNIYNITEFDFHDISYDYFLEHFTKILTGVAYDPTEIATAFYTTMTNIFELQMTTEKIQKFIKDKNNKFDLILCETLSKPCLGYTHIFNAPVIMISSLYIAVEDFNIFGIPLHPLVPNFLAMRLHDLSIWEKLHEIYILYKSAWNIYKNRELENNVMKRVFGEDIPKVEELHNNVHMMFANVNPIFDFNRALPPNVLCLGGIHMNPVSKLPTDLQNYMDASKNGVIYLSFGTNVKPSILPPSIRKIFVKVLSELPYNVITKWDTDDFDGVKNVKVGNWWPQNDLLRHKNMKLFITQAGLQSTDEAIDAHVPMVALPTFADQYFNAERYVTLGIGKKLTYETLTEKALRDAIEEVIGNESYRRNIIQLGKLVKDQPQTPLEKAVWWTEYVIRNGGAKHLRSPLANISWTKYLMLDLVAVLLLALIVIVTIVVVILRSVLRFFSSSGKSKKE